jgi:hypothetical protein
LTDFGLIRKFRTKRLNKIDTWYSGWLYDVATDILLHEIRMYVQQGDQIGRFVYFGQFFEKERSSPNYVATFFRRKKVIFLVWTKMDWATLWAIFFTNSSGHPDSQFAGGNRVSQLTFEFANKVKK